MPRDQIREAFEQLEDRNDDFLKRTFQTREATPISEHGISTTKYGKVDKAKMVRLHEYPNDSSSNVIDAISKGVLVEILGEEKGYFKVLPVAVGGNNRTGYIKKEFITEVL